MYFVLLALEPLEEPAHAFVGPIALDDELALLVGQVTPGHVHPHIAGTGGALQFGQGRLVVRLGPGLDGPASHRLPRVGNHEVHVDFDDIAEAVAVGAGPEGVVEREEPGLRVLVGDVAGAALEPFGILDAGISARLPVGIEYPGDSAALPIRHLDRVGEAGAGVGVDANPIDHHAQFRPALQLFRIDIVESQHLAVDDHAPEALAPQGVQFTHAGRQCGGVGSALGGGIGRPHFGRIVLGGPPQVDQGQVEPDHQAAACGAREKFRGHRLGGLAPHGLAALTAQGRAHP